MPKGGYKIIDFKGINITTDSTVVPGIYSAIESGIGKPLMFKNFSIGGVEQPVLFSPILLGGNNCYGFRGLSSSNYECIVIGSDDGVKLIGGAFASSLSVNNVKMVAEEEVK